MKGTQREILAEALRAQERYGPMRSTHEALGVLLEEFIELQDAIRANDLPQVRKEAIQLSAVALRLAAENTPEFLDRSGFELKKSYFDTAQSNLSAAAGQGRMFA